MIGLLFTLVIAALIIWAVKQVLPALGIPPNIAHVIYVVVVVLVVLYVVSALLRVVP